MSSVNSNMFDAGVIRELPMKGPALMRLPLNLIALVVAHLRDVADLARLCRTCRVLNYMAIPQLYKNLTLTSYGTIRFNEDDCPEGHGSASPFSMGLSALVTRNVAPLVRSMTLRGEWRDDGLEEHARVGRVPDSAMMLNICVRAAIDKMAGLESFNWEIYNTKALETIYQGLAQLQNLQSLTLRFPSTRHPRPTTTIPPMPNLRILKVTDIDPLCYPDDISLLLHGSRKLVDLRMHWSFRMRELQEPSVVLSDYFRRCIASKNPLRLKKLSFQNFYALNSGEEGPGVYHPAVEELSMISNPADRRTMLTFVEASWPNPGLRGGMPNLKSFRLDRVEKRSLEFLQHIRPLESLYFVNPLREPMDYINNSRTEFSYLSSPSTPFASGTSNSTISNDHGQLNQSTPPTLNSQASLASRVSLKESHISTIIDHHGPTLKRLLLSAQFNVPVPLVVRLVHACPNLEQLALAVDGNSLEATGLVLPFLRKLEALRLLIPITQDSDPKSGTPVGNPNTYGKAHSPETSGTSTSSPMPDNMARPDLSALPPSDALGMARLIDIDDAFHAEALSSRLAEAIFNNLKVLGFGWKAWQIGGLYKIPVSKATAPHTVSNAQDSGTYATADIPSHGLNSDSPTELTNIAISGGEAYGSEIYTTQSWSGRTAQASSSQGGRLLPGKRKYSDLNSSIPPPPLAEPKAKRSQNHTQIASFSDSPYIRSAVAGDGNDTPEKPNLSALSFVDQSTLAQIPENLRLQIKDCFTEIRSGTEDNPFVWKRHVKRVGWDVLKQWEIWGLDVQEI